MIIFPAPVVEFVLRIFQREKPVNVQALIPQTAVICLNTYRQTLAQHPQPFHHTDHILTFQRLSCMDRQTLPTKIIHYSQRPETSSVKQVTLTQVQCMKTSLLSEAGSRPGLLTLSSFSREA